MKNILNVGISGYGVYIPRYRIRTSDIAKVWGKDPKIVENSLKLKEKSVAFSDEDMITQAYEAGFLAIETSGVDPKDIEVCFTGSESHPYAVNPSSTIAAEFLGLSSSYLAVDMEFACKAATTAIISLVGLIAARKVSRGLVIGSDVAQSKPHDILEYTAASGAAGYVLEKKNPKTIAEFIEWSSFSSDTPDFWRRDGVRFPSHAGRFSGEPAYYNHIAKAARTLLKKNNVKPSDFDYCVFHMPNGKFPRQIAKRLGFVKKQIEPSLIVDKVGNPYAATVLIGLAAVLDQAKADEKIFLASYGSGAGSDAFIIKTTKQIEKFKKKSVKVDDLINDKKYISYLDYLKYRKKI